MQRKRWATLRLILLRADGGDVELAEGEDRVIDAHGTRSRPAPT